MKILKNSLLDTLILAIASIGTAFKNTVENSKPERFFTTDTYGWITTGHLGGNFEIGVTASTELSDASNWDNSNPACSGSTYVCKATAAYTLSGTQTAPTKQQVIDKIKTQYDLNQTPRFPTNGWTVAIGGVNVTITVILKN